MGKKVFWRGTALLMCVIIFAATASPAATGESTQGVIERILNLPEAQAATLNVTIRKLSHATVFGVLAVVAFFAQDSRTRRAYIASWSFATVYGGLDEFHQSFVPGRGPSIVDVGIDSAGALVALTIVYGFMRRKREAGVRI